MTPTSLSQLTQALIAGTWKYVVLFFGFPMEIILHNIWLLALLVVAAVVAILVKLRRR